MHTVKQGIEVSMEWLTCVYGPLDDAVHSDQTGRGKVESVST